MRKTFSPLLVLAAALVAPSALAQKSPTPAPAKPAAPAASTPAPAKPAASTPAPAKPAAPVASTPAPAKPAAPAAPPAKPAAPAAPPAKPAAPAAAPEFKPVATSIATPGAPLDKASEQQKKDAAAAMKAGRAAFDTSKYEEALAKFRESYASVASPNSRMMLARTLGKLGRLTDAYREAKCAGDEANAAAIGNPKYKATADGVRDDIADLEKKLAFVTIKVMGEPDEATLTIGGVAVDRKQWGQPVPVAPGRVEVALATADGKSREVLDLLAGAKVSLPLDMPTPRVADESVSATVRVKSTWTGPDRKTIGYLASGVGGTGMLLFATFGSLANGQYSRLDSGCPSQRNCDPALADVADRGKAYQAVANTSLALGLVGLATGATFITWDAMDGGGWPWESAGIVKPRLAVGPGEVTLSGSF